MKFSAMTLAAFLFCMPPGAFAREEVAVSAAASLTNAFSELGAAFEKARPGLKIRFNFAASNPLLRQIVDGAPADVFASADQESMDSAVRAGVADPATRQNFAGNELALIVPRGSRAPGNLEELIGMERIAIGDPESVPAGRYARAALQSAGLYDRLSPALIPGSSVRQVLDYVARGEVDAGFVYATDARQQKDRVDVAFMAGGHEPITYPIAVARTGGNPDAGRAFINFVLSREGRDILSGYGFKPYEAKN